MIVDWIVMGHRFQLRIKKKGGTFRVNATKENFSKTLLNP